LSLAVAGVWFISAAMMGLRRASLGFAARVCYGVTGLCLFMPANVLGAERWINAAGVGLAVALFVREKPSAGRAVAAGDEAPGSNREKLQGSRSSAW